MPIVYVKKSKQMFLYDSTSKSVNGKILFWIHIEVFSLAWVGEETYSMLFIFTNLSVKSTVGKRRLGCQLSQCFGTIYNNCFQDLLSSTYNLSKYPCTKCLCYITCCLSYCSFRYILITIWTTICLGNHNSYSTWSHTSKILSFLWIPLFDQVKYRLIVYCPCQLIVKLW